MILAKTRFQLSGPAGLRKIAIAAALSATALASPALAQVTGSFTVDNAYAVYIGDANGNIGVTPTLNGNPIPNPVVQEINKTKAAIDAGETFEFDYVPDCHIYLVAWSDNQILQGALGSFSGATSFSTGDPRIRVGAAFNDKNSALGEFPSAAEVQAAIDALNQGQNGGWVTPVVDTSGIMAYTFPNLPIPGLAPDAEWIWHDSGKHVNNYAPFAGFGHDEFLVFNIPCNELGDPGGGPAQPEPIADKCYAPVGETSLEDLFEAQLQANQGDPYRMMLDPVVWADFSAKMQTWIDGLNAHDPNTTELTIHFQIQDVGPAGSSPNSPSNPVPSMQDVYMTWTAGSSAGPTGSGLFWSTYGLQPNRQYIIRTNVYPNGDSQTEIDGDCLGFRTFAWLFRPKSQGNNTGVFIFGTGKDRRVVQP